MWGNGKRVGGVVRRVGIGGGGFLVIDILYRSTVDYGAVRWREAHVRILGSERSGPKGIHGVHWDGLD
jgi:hypothetical protein